MIYISHPVQYGTVYLVESFIELHANSSAIACTAAFVGNQPNENVKNDTFSIQIELKLEQQTLHCIFGCNQYYLPT